MISYEIVCGSWLIFLTSSCILEISVFLDFGSSEIVYVMSWSAIINDDLSWTFFWSASCWIDSCYVGVPEIFGSVMMLLILLS